ncbi:hypothetical protein ISI85_001879 [Campylobacter coli]|nr:hypothetical protein YSQ_01350 [Campylobacter coli RM1875]AHK74541.1 hypothetical protein YSU_01365 [Campylobacter coli RM5611]ALL29681.1 hypothetical protein AR449_01860 [Campylobacter coli]EIA43218.1 hypothetical protein cco100_03172 [Campylobacter coli Z163]EIA59575.1 hypothetical protein cco12_04356 [Campylobacter coli 84-2]EIA65198.1 hypothetical protein cco23_06955 [Campylobacter coli 1098]EIA66159.1 hypothetical protein cco19_02301 [Campylobacter coli 1091]EIA71575.1 hypothetical p
MQYFCAEKENCCAVYIMDKNSNDEYIKKIKIKLKREETIILIFLIINTSFLSYRLCLLKRINCKILY